MAKLIAQTYGEALYELAIEENKVDELRDEVEVLKLAFADGDDLMKFMKHPQVTNEEKRQTMETCLKGKVSQDLIAFVLIIIEKERFSEIQSIFDYYINAVKKLKGIGTAYVTTPQSLSDELKDKTKERLLSTTGFKEIEIVYDTDPSLIGGMVIRIGDRVVDSSVKSQLYELKKNLIKVQLANN